MVHADTDPLAVLERLVRVGGTAALSVFEQGLSVRIKPDGSPVTDADLAAESSILASLEELFGEFGIVSEERGSSGPIAGARWYVDPVDGTSALVEGLAHWGPTVALVSAEGQVLLGATALPRLGELWGVRRVGEGWVARFNDAPLGQLGACKGALCIPSGLHQSVRLRWAGKARCLGGTAAHLALASRGSAAAALVGPNWHVWDVATGLALIDAVGGIARTLADNRPLHLFRDLGAPFVAGHPHAVERLLSPGGLGPF